jgi:hypothetical protein
MFMKSRYIAAPAESAWVEFRARFEQVLTGFERSVVPQLTAEDI